MVKSFIARQNEAGRVMLKAITKGTSIPHNVAAEANYCNDLPDAV